LSEVNQLTESSIYRVDFLAGQYFDIRLEVHSPINGSEARAGEPDPNFTFTIAKKGDSPVAATEFFKVDEPKLERWNFTWYEGKSLLPLSLPVREDRPRKN
jgi:hypothetical protein